MYEAEKLPELSYPESGIDITDETNEGMKEKPSDIHVPVDLDIDVPSETEPNDELAGMSPAEIMKSDARSGFTSMERSAPPSEIETMADVTHHATLEDHHEAPIVSGIQTIELGEHVQELFQDSDLMETLSVAINTARESGKSEAIVTCEQEGDSMCLALEQELITRKERGTIYNYIKKPMSGRIGFRIMLEKPVVQSDIIEEEDMNDLAA